MLLHLQLCALVRRRLGRGRPRTHRHELPSFRPIDEKERSPIERESDAGLNPKRSGFEPDRYLGGDIAKRDRNLWTKDLDGKRCGSRGCRPEPTDVEAEADTYRRSQARKAAKRYGEEGRKKKERVEFCSERGERLRGSTDMARGSRSACLALFLLVVGSWCWVGVGAGESSCECDEQGEPWGFTGGCKACTCPSKNDNGTWEGVPANNCSATSDCDACVCCATDVSGNPPPLSPGVIYLGNCASGFHLEVQGCECVCVFNGYSQWEVAMTVVFAIVLAILVGLCCYSFFKNKRNPGASSGGDDRWSLNPCPFFRRKGSTPMPAAAYITDGQEMVMSSVPAETPPRHSTDEYENVDLGRMAAEDLSEEAPKSAREQRRNPWRSVD